MIKLKEYKFKEEYTYYLLQALKEERKEVFRKDYLELHPSDRTEFFEGLDDHKCLQLCSFLTPLEFGEIFSELKSGLQHKMIIELDPGYAAQLLNELPTDEAMVFWGILPHLEANQIFRCIS